MAAGNHIQAFPEYGPERMGGPLKAFTRISENEIRSHAQVTNPNVVVVLDPTLMGKIDVFDGVPVDGVVIVNTDETPKELRQRLNVSGRKIFTLSATQIALETIKRPIPNTPMIGALIKVTSMLDLGKVMAHIKERFSEKFRPEIVEGNLKAIERAYQEVRGE